MSNATPNHLDDAGRALWAKVTDTHDLRPDEFRVLEDACREADIIDMMEAARREPSFSLMVRGSQGQSVINPLISELRQHRQTIAALLRQLKLTESEGETSEEVSSKARAAANARWSRVRGTG